ncbi:MAG: restriction endonuclease subunit S [Muribaculaceae bacterium]|nr:restriction endonuclease subunit S [Muribaculaceae bacterium]
MKRLNEVKWELFFLSEIFDFDKGNQNDMNTLLPGNTPLISAKKVDNGLKAFVIPNQKKQFSGHCITLNLDGDGGAGLAYYQPRKMLLDSHVCALIPKKTISRESLLFLSRIITSQGDAYGHGHSINKNRLRVFRIMLPVSAPHTPDYGYMGEYMRNKEKEMLTKYKRYLEKSIATEKDFTLCLDSKRWKEFSLSEIFTISSSVRLTKDDMIKGARPFIGASDSDNGVTAFVGNTNKSLDKNVLGVNYNGSVVENFYHPYEAIFSDDVKRLHLKEYNDDKYVLLFIKQSILMQKRKYEYGYKFNGERMKRQRIMLPVSSSNIPDYAYMGEYMRNKEKDLLAKYKRYLNKHIKEEKNNNPCLDISLFRP